jgi:LacI family transcriptional regulator
MAGRPRERRAGAAYREGEGHKAAEVARRPVGIKDIARALGISIGTVDRALHSRGGINPITRDRVLKMAQTLGYKPNLAARYLKVPRHLKISVNLPQQIASFYDQVRTGIRNASSPFEPGVDLFFRNHPVLGEGETELLEQALDDGSKGIIISPGRPGQLKGWIRKAAQKGVPVACVVTDAPGTERLTTVSTDSFTSGGIVAELLARMLPDKGTVAVMTGDLSTCDHSEKLQGFEKNLGFADGRLKISAVLESHDDEKSAYKQTRDLLLHDRHLRAIYVSTANSLSVIRAVEEVDPDRSLAIITTDLFPELVPLLRSGRVLATINQRPERQGRMAFEALYHFLVEGKCPPSRIKLNPHIVMRSNLDLFLEPVPGNGNWYQPEPVLP